MKESVDKYINMLKLKRYSVNTQRNYLKTFQHFLASFYGKNIADLKKQEIHNFLLEQIEIGMSSSFQDLQIDAIKFYYEKELGRKRGTDLRYTNELLKHPNSKTTEIYTHITKEGLCRIINPLDNLT